MALSPTEQRLADVVTRALYAPPGITALVALSGVPDAVREAVSKLRALQLTDLTYLGGQASSDIADELNEQVDRAGQLTHSALRFTMATYGPAEYIGVEQHPDGQLAVVPVPITAVHQTRRALAAATKRGVRFAPAVWEIDPVTADLGELWSRLGGADTTEGNP